VCITLITNERQGTQSEQKDNCQIQWCTHNSQVGVTQEGRQESACPGLDLQLSLVKLFIEIECPEAELFLGDQADSLW